MTNPTNEVPRPYGPGLFEGKTKRMTKQNIIPAGYRITVESWENDADNYKTEIVDGIETPEQVRLYVALCDLLTGCEHDNGGKYGNMYDPPDGEIAGFDAAARDVLMKNAAGLRQGYSLPVAAGDEDDEDEDEDEDYKFPYASLANEILYDFTGSSEFYTRVISKIVVEYIPHDVLIDDVTADFM